MSGKPTADLLQQYRASKRQNGLNEVDSGQGAIGDVVDATQQGLYEGVAGIGEFVGLDGVRDWAKQGSAEQNLTISARGRDAMGKQFFETDNGDESQLYAGDAWSDPRAIAMQLGRVIGMNADIVAGGGTVTAGRMAVTKVAKAARQKMIQKGAPAALADEVAKEASKTFMQKHLAAYGDTAKQLAGNVFDYGTAGHAVSGGLQAIDIRDEVNETDFEQLAELPEYKQLVMGLQQANPQADAQLILGEARKQLGEQAASAIKTNPTLLTANMLVGGLGTTALTHILRGVMPKGAGIATELAVEGTQGAMEQVAMNQEGQRYVDADRQLTDGVLVAGLNEAVMGGAMGAAAAGGRAVADRAAAEINKRRAPQPAQLDASILPIPEDDADLDMGPDLDALADSDPGAVYADRAAKVRKYSPDFVDRVTELVTSDPQKTMAAAATMDNYLASYDYGERAEARLAEYLNQDITAAERGDVTLPDREQTTPEQDSEDYQQLFAVTEQQHPDFAKKMQMYVDAKPGNVGLAADVMARYLAEPDFRALAQSRVDEHLAELGYTKRNAADAALVESEQVEGNTNVLQNNQSNNKVIASVGLEEGRPEVGWAKTFVTEHQEVNGDLPPADLLKDTFDLTDAELAEVLSGVDAGAPAEAANEIEPLALQVEDNAQQAATSVQNDLPEPTAAQVKAGNYKKGKVKLHGMDISVENPRGSVRKGTDQNGRDWEIELQDSYGYIRRTTGADNEQVDVFIGSYPESDRVFVVDQVNADGSFDEHKVILGATDMDDAIETYSRNYEQGWVVGPVTEMSVPEFKNWLKDGDTKAPLQLESATPSPAVDTQTEQATKVPGISDEVGALYQARKPIPLSLKPGRDVYRTDDRAITRALGLDAIPVPGVDAKQDSVFAKAGLLSVMVDRALNPEPLFGNVSQTAIDNARKAGKATPELMRELELPAALQGYVDEKLPDIFAAHKTLKGTGKPAPVANAADVPAQQDNGVKADAAGLTVEHYSDKSIVVRGDTKPYKEQLNALKGVYNPRLKGGAGWVFGKKREQEIRTAIEEINAQSNTDVLQNEDAENVSDTAAGMATDGGNADATNAVGNSAGQAGRTEAGQRSGETAADVTTAGAGSEGGRDLPAAGTADAGNAGTDAVRAGSKQRRADDIAAEPAGKGAAVGNTDDAGVQPDDSANRAAAKPVTAGADKPALTAAALTPAQVEQRLVDYLLPQYAKQTEDAKADPYMVAKALIERPATKTNFNREQTEYANRNSDIAGYRALTEALNNIDPDAVIAGLAEQVKAYRAEQALRIKLKGELDKKAAAQLKAERVPFVQGDVQNVRDTLPYLDELQQDDVVKAEQRLFVQNERGMLLANGTGTGKTFSGGGVIKRAIKRGAKRVLVVSPAGMTNDWKQGLSALQIDSAPLASTQDSGQDSVVALTSYENFYQNRALLDQPWDLLVYDESHKLMGNMQGEETQALNVHRMLSRYSDYSSKLRAREFLQPEADAITEKLRDLIAKEAKRKGQTLQAAEKEFDEKPYWAPYEKKVEALAKKYESWYADKQTKTLFLSASPFATHHALFYMDGYIFDSKEGASTSQAYNTGSAQQQFLVNNLGYRMRYNKANRPEKGVDVGLLERELADKFVASGAMSIRRLEVERDYSREFVKVNSALGQKLQQGFDVLNQKEFSHLASKMYEVMKGGKDHELLEALRAKESIERIKQHLALGRKVVVFHERQEISIKHPFRLPETGDAAYRAQLDVFKRNYPELYNLPLTGLSSVPAQLEKAFGRDAIALFSGRNKKDRQKELDAFKQDGGKRNILVIQKQAGKEGISPHDVTGKHPRALMIMNTPVSPTDLIQMEGRVFRRGLASNAIIELPIIGTQFEMHRYRSVVSERTGTAENLAMGNQARDLRNVLREGYLDPRLGAPDAKQGVGGKEADNKDQTVSTFEKAKTYYWKRAKKTSKNKSAEGDDYFATPEPVGLAMVRMADIKTGDKALEPSGGHGAIARWLPETASNVAIELSRELSPELAMVTDGKVIEGNFYDHHIVNKYHSIVMNPPFGHGGSEAIKFIEKGFKHLYNGGRMVAIVPRGKMDERLDKWLAEQQDAHLVATINLPGNTFNRAGTGVITRVVIVDKDKRGSSDYARNIDLSSIEDINQLFERVNEIDIRPRPDVTVTAAEVGLYQQNKSVEGKPLIEVSRHGRAKPGVDNKLLKKLAERFNGEVSKDSWNDTVYQFDRQIDANRFYEALLDQIEKTEAGVELELDVAPSLGDSGNSDSKTAGVDGRAAGEAGSKVALDAGKAIAARFDASLADSGRGTVVAQSFAHFPKAIVDLLQQTDLVHAKGFLFEGRVYINLQHIESTQDLQNTLVHERLRHYGIRKVFGADVFKQLNKIAVSLGNTKVRQLAERYGVDVDAYERFYANKSDAKGRLLDEVLAHVQEADVPARTWGLIGELKTQLKLWVNRVFGDTWAYNEADLFNLIAVSKRSVTGKAADFNAPYLQPHLTTGYIDAEGVDVAPSFATKARQSVIDSVAAIQQTRLDGLAKVLKPSNVWQAIKLRWPNLRPAMLATIPRNYLADIAGHLLPSLQTYNKQVAAMEAERNELLSQTHETADAWRKLVSADRKASEQLADLMHEATLVGVDPSHDEYKPNITPQIAKVLQDRARAFIRSRNGEAWAVSRGMQRLERIKDALDKEPSQAMAYAQLRKAYLALPEAHQQMFKQVRDDYKGMSQQRREALENRIKDLIQDKRVSAAQIALMQEEFELADIAGVYFPLQRFGKYRAVAKDAATGETLAYSMFESNVDMQQWLKEQAKEGVITDGGYMFDYSRSLDGVGSGFMKDLLKQLAPIFDRNDKLQDEVYQLFLQHSPELSMRKHMIHRKGVKGFDADALRAYAHNMFHGAYQVAKTKHTHHMQSHLMAMEDEAKGVANTDDKVRAVQVVNEMQKRNDWILNPQGSEFAAKMTGFGFFWYLGTSPAAALVNITQTPMIGLPVLGSRYGYKGSAKALLDASKDFIKGRGHADKALSGLELDAFRAFEKSGVIDKTQAHDVTGIADGGVAYSPRYHKVMKVAGFMFHHAERFNREVTAMAAYRLAFNKVKQEVTGKPAGVVEALAHAKAIDAAMELVKLSHFDYANSNRARVIQSDAARVLLLFRQHSINMTYRLLRDFQQSFWGSPEDKAQARKQLAGILGIGLLFSGAAGLPLYSVVAGIFNTLGGDEDEPFDFDVAVRAMLADAIGETAASLVMNGSAGTLTAADLTGRIGMNNLWFREPDVTLEGEAVVQYYAEQALGPIFGIATGWGRAAYLANQGETGRAWEAAVPKFARDWFKSVRFANEGVLSRRGDAIIDELSPWQIALQANGFTPLELSEQYRENSHVKTTERVILERRKLLMNRYALGKRLYDNDLVDETMEAIERFNDTNPAVAISAADRVRSLKMRAATSERANNGVVVSKKLAYLQQEN